MRIIRALVAFTPALLVALAPACAGDRSVPSMPPAQTESTAASEEATAARRREERAQAARERLEALPRPAPAPAAPESAMPAPDKLERIRKDAATRAGLDPSAVRVTSSERVTWNDGSLGCPAPGQFYTQMLVSGYRVLVAAGDRTFDYRLADSGSFRLCPTGAAPEIPGAGRADR